MKIHTAIKVQVLVLALSASGAALSADPGKQAEVETTAEFKSIMKSVDEVKRLPVTGLSMVRADNKVFLISDNGHFVVAGNLKLLDMWQGKVINSIADTNGMDKVDLRKIGLNPDELSVFTIGTGKREVTLFIDPQCDYCHNLLVQMEALGKDYQFKLVLVPVLGKESAEITKRLLCTTDKAAALKALIAKEYTTLPQLSKDTKCDLKPLQKAVVATKLLDIQGVPYIFLASKNTHRGGTKVLKTLLEKDLEDEINGG